METVLELCRTAHFGALSLLLVIIIVCLSTQITDPFRTSVRVSGSLVHIEIYIEMFHLSGQATKSKTANSSTIPDQGNARFLAAFKDSSEVSIGLKSGLDFLNPLPGWKF